MFVMTGCHVVERARWIHSVMTSGRFVGESFPLGLNRSFCSNATHSRTSSAQHSPNGLSEDCSILSEVENQAGTPVSAGVSVTSSNAGPAAHEQPEASRTFLREGQVTPGTFAFPNAAALDLLGLGSDTSCPPSVPFSKREDGGGREGEADTAGTG